MTMLRGTRLVDRLQGAAWKGVVTFAVVIESAMAAIGQMVSIRVFEDGCC